MEVTVLHNQSILDIAIQHTGSVTNALIIAAANDLAVSDSLTAGSILFLPSSVLMDEDIQKYYKANALKPATSITNPNVIPAGRGIGWMQVNNDFKVTKDKDEQDIN